MDINRIFNLFGSDDGDFEGTLNDGFEREDEFEEFKTTPLYKIGMFEKMILNHNNFSHSVKNIFKQSKDSINIPEVEEAGEYIAYFRAWFYIRELDLSDSCWMEGLLLRGNDYLTTAVKMAIHYFESLEEFEKCAFLKSIQLFLEDNLESKS